MFRKQIKIKSNVALKNSDRKNLRDEIQKQFPSLTPDDLNNLLSKKEILNNVKILTASEETIQVYTVQKKAICFKLNGKIFPTLSTLWQFPNLIPMITTNTNVVPFLKSGADLMLPGVVTPPVHSNLPKYGNIQKDDIVAINLCSNRAAFAVGTAAMSSYDMERSSLGGKCVTILHFYGDKLCSLEAQISMPNFGPPEWLTLGNYKEDFPALGAPEKCKKETVGNPAVIESDQLIETGIQPKENDTEITLDANSETHEMTVEDVDNLLHHCFLTAIKYSKTLSLPVLTSNFNKLYLLPACPPNKTLDIKKSSFKKLKPFLDKMCQENIITIKEIKKGVESIVSINKNHPTFEAFYVKPEDRPVVQKDENNDDKTQITESYIITQPVLPIFSCGESNLKKGDTVLGSNVRKHIRQYVMANNCQHENPQLIKVDQTLSNLCKNKTAITWEELYEKVCNSMKNRFTVSTGHEEIVNKGKVSPITITVANRTGNKKVTLVDNLDMFGIRIPDFAKDCQHGVAASTSISTPPGNKGEQLLVQGNQVLFVYNLLIDKYKIPKRYVKGLENAPKKKK